MKTKLTERQNEILAFISQYHEINGYPPTLREIGKEFNISSTFGVKRHLDALVKKGYLKIEGFASRGLTILPQNKFKDSFSELSEIIQKEPKGIPIVGRVAAGFPILATENIEGNIIIDPSFIKNSSNNFALKVKGDSMINAGIFEGDILIINPVKEAKNGEIIVALIGDEATVKRYELKGNIVRLIPENDNYKPIELNKIEDFSIIGIVVGVIRWYN